MLFFPQVTNKDKLGEITALAQGLDSIVCSQPLAEFSSADGTVKPGSAATVPVEVKIRRSRRLGGCSGSYCGGNTIYLTIAPDATWAEVLETTMHELCHRMRPSNEVHSPKFWDLLRSSLRSAWGIEVPQQAPQKGMGLYWRDSMAVALLESQYDWARRQVFA